MKTLKPSDRRKFLLTAGLGTAGVAAAVVTALVVSDEMSQQEQRLARVEAQVGSAATRRAALVAMATAPFCP